MTPAPTAQSREIGIDMILKTAGDRYVTWHVSLQNRNIVTTPRLGPVDPGNVQAAVFNLVDRDSHATVRTIEIDGATWNGLESADALDDTWLGILDGMIGTRSDLESFASGYLPASGDPEDRPETDAESVGAFAPY